MKCTDCHSKATGDTGGIGPHGSSNRFLLRAPWYPTGAEGTLTGTTGTTTHLCFLCHNWDYYAGTNGGSTTNRSGFFLTGKYNLHAIGDHSTAGKKYGCAYCHGGLPHGWRYENPVWGYDAPRPYKDGVGTDMGTSSGYTNAPGAEWPKHTNEANCSGVCGKS